MTGRRRTCYPTRFERRQRSGSSPYRKNRSSIWPPVSMTPSGNKERPGHPVAFVLGPVQGEIEDALTRAGEQTRQAGPEPAGAVVRDENDGEVAPLGRGTTMSGSVPSQKAWPKLEGGHVQPERACVDHAAVATFLEPLRHS